MGVVTLLVQPDKQIERVVAGSDKHDALKMLKKSDFRSWCRNMEEWFNAPQKLFGGRRQYLPIRFAAEAVCCTMRRVTP
jgi:hypothetical protein